MPASLFSIDARMAWRNIWRNPRRSVLTLLAIAFACALLVFMLSWQFGSYELMIKSALSISTGQMQIQAEGYQEKRAMRLVVPDPERIAAKLDAMPDVAAYTFRGAAFALLSSENRTYGAMINGIDPTREAGVTNLKSLIRKGEYLAPGDQDQALVGKLLAKNLRVGLGDELVMLGQGRDGGIAASIYYVKGIYSSGQNEFDRSMIHVPLANFQDVFNMRGAVHEVVVNGRSLDDIPKVKKELQDSVGGPVPGNARAKPLVVLDWKEMMPGLLQSIQMDLGGGVVFYLLLVIVVAFSIMNTFLMAVFERTKEFGVLLALGTRPWRLIKILLYESFALALLGMLAGIALGGGVTLYFEGVGIQISGTEAVMAEYGLPERIFPKLTMLSLWVGPMCVLFITMLTALYPAFRVRRLKPVEAMASA